MKRTQIEIAIIVGIILLTATSLCVAQIGFTKHNLSVSGPGPIKSTTEEEICVFCHVPHTARTDAPFLWNREDSTASYTTYQSSTLYGVVGQPTGASKLCLSCHDGTIALGALVSRPTEIPFAGGIRFLPDVASKLGTDLSDDHPVSFIYDENLAIDNGELIPPSALPGNVKLEQGSIMQCTSCHDAHDDTFGNFLVSSNQFSGLCVTCHDPKNWPLSSHANSTATWTGLGADPWPQSSYDTVMENACGNCHTPHTAGTHARLLRFSVEESNCLVCHNGNVAATDIEAELLKTYGHFVQNYIGVHDPTEDFTGFVSTHVECADCHNPHQVNALGGTAPNISGLLEGVSGITVSGIQVEEATFAYEICFKCHGDNNVTTFTEISREISQINTRLEFDIANPSFHPVTGIGKNLNVPSLLSPYTVNSVIYCTDCHNSDDNPNTGGAGPRGPHGSIYKPLLEEHYSTTDFTVESSFEYALCYKCHDRNSIRADESFGEHNRHVFGGGGMGGGMGINAPCSACHDPHGVSVTQGNSTNNSHLINFDINIVSPSASGLLQFEDLGTFRGRCFLNCHGKEHNPKTY